MVDGDLLCKLGGIVGAQKGAAVRVDAYAEVADSDLEHGIADDVGDCRDDARVDLGLGEDGRVGFIVERY